MRRDRVFRQLAAWGGGVASILVFALALQAGAAMSQDVEEGVREADLARAAESSGVASGEMEMLLEGNIYPLFIGVDDENLPTYAISPTTNISMTLFTGFQVWGAAYDAVNDIVYFNNGTTLYEWPVGGTVTTLGTMTDPDGAAQLMIGLAFYNGQLYGTKNSATEAIWAIDTTTLVATIHITYSSVHDMGGLAVNPNSGEFYATDDGTHALVRINGDGTVETIAAYPAGQNDIDGLAISEDGIAYLVVDQDGFIYVYDLNAGVYETPLISPWTSLETFAGAAYVTPSNEPDIEVSPISLESSQPPDTTMTETLTISNVGDSMLDWTICVDVLWASVGQSNGSTGPGGSTDVEVTFDSAGLSAGTYTGTLCVVSNDPDEPEVVIALTLNVEAPEIEIAPDELISTQFVDMTTVLTLTISNLGTADLDWLIVDVPAPGGTPGADNFPRGRHAPSAGMAPNATPVRETGGILSEWLGTTAYSWNAQNGPYYTIFDLDVPGVLPNIVAFPGAGQFIGAGEHVNGLVYMADMDDNMWEVDPATGTILNGYTSTPLPGGQYWAGMALDPTTGIVYASSTDIATSALYTMDPATGVATLVGTVTNAPGLIGIAVDGDGDLWGYEVVNDVFLSIDKSSGAGTVIGSIGFDANFGQGLGWDPATDTVYMAAFNNGQYQGELRAVDTATGNTTFLGVLGSSVPGDLNQLSFLAIDLSAAGGQACDSPAGTPWLSANPTSGTTASGGSTDVAVTFDSTALVSGTYTATLCIDSNDPDEGLLRVPLTLNVEEPSYGVAMSGDMAASGGPGKTVTYTVLVTNTGDVADTFSLALSSNSWAATLSDGSVGLNPGESADVTVEVTIPGDAGDGEMDTVTVTATSDSDPGASDSINLTTTAVESKFIYTLYLPSILNKP